VTIIGARPRSLQAGLGFALVAAGFALEVWAQSVPALSLIGWALAFIGTLFCGKTLTGDFGWCLLALMPVIGAPLAVAGIVAYYNFSSGPWIENDASKAFRPRDFAVMLVGLSILFGGCLIFSVNHFRALAH
jgi:hypothetical protein